MATALPYSTPFCSQSAREKRFAEQHKQQTRNEDSEGYPQPTTTQRSGSWATVVEQWVLQQGLCLTSALQGEGVTVPNKLLSDLLQEPLTHSLPPVKNRCVGSCSPKQVFLAPAVFASTCLDPAK